MSRANAEPGGLFAPGVVVAIVLIAFVGFLAVVSLGTYEPQFRRGDNGEAHALSKSAVGFAGLVQLLDGSGRISEVVRTERLYAEADEPGLMILTLPLHGDPKTPLFDLPTTRDFEGSVVAVMPKWLTNTLRIRRGWVRKEEPDDEIDADTWLGPSEGAAKIELMIVPGKARHTLTLTEEGRDPLTLRTGEIDRFQVFKSWPGFNPLITDEAGHMVLGYTDEGDFFALSDPDLLNNHGIADLTAARTAVSLIDEMRYDGPVYFDVTLAGLASARSPLKLLLEPPFLSATICALGAAFLMIWHSAFGFGAPRLLSGREFALGKQALADNQAGLVRMARREARMGGRYAQLMAALVARAVGAPRDLTPDKTDAFLDRLSKGRGAEVLTTLRDAADTAADRGQLMDAALRLHRWKREMTREAR